MEWSEESLSRQGSRRPCLNPAHSWKYQGCCLKTSQERNHALKLYTVKSDNKIYTLTKFLYLYMKSQFFLMFVSLSLCRILFFIRCFVKSPNFRSKSFFFFFLNRVFTWKLYPRGKTYRHNFSGDVRSTRNIIEHSLFRRAPGKPAARRSTSVVRLISAPWILT